MDAVCGPGHSKAFSAPSAQHLRAFTSRPQSSDAAFAFFFLGGDQNKTPKQSRIRKRSDHQMIHGRWHFRGWCSMCPWQTQGLLRAIQPRQLSSDATFTFFLFGDQNKTPKQNRNRKHGNDRLTSAMHNKTRNKSLEQNHGKSKH